MTYNVLILKAFSLMGEIGGKQTEREQSYFVPKSQTSKMVENTA